MPKPYCFLCYRVSAATWKFTSGKSHIYVLVQPDAAARRGFKMVLFTQPSEHLCRRYMSSTECPSGSLNITTRDKSFSIEQGSDLGVQSVRRLWHATVKCIYRMSVLSFVLLLQNVEKAIRLNVEKQMLQRLSENEGKSAVLKTGKTTKSSKTTA